MVLYSQYRARTTTTPVETPTTTPQQPLSGRRLVFEERATRIAYQDLQEARRKKERLEEYYDNKRQKIRNKYGGASTPEAAQAIADLEQQKAERMRAIDAEIAQKQSSVATRSERVATTTAGYTQEEIAAARASQPQDKGRFPVASMSELRAERQRQAADRELLEQQERAPGIVQPGQLKSQYYAARYGGGSYTSLGPGAFVTTIREPVATKKTGGVILGKRQAVMVGVGSQYSTPQGVRSIPYRPEERTYTGVDLFNRQNREVLSSQAWRYGTARELVEETSKPPRYSFEPLSRLPRQAAERSTFLGNLGKIQASSDAYVRSKVEALASSSERDLVRSNEYYTPSTYTVGVTQRARTAFYTVSGTAKAYAGVPAEAYLSLRESRTASTVQRFGTAIAAGAAFGLAETGLSRLTFSKRTYVRIAGAGGRTLVRTAGVVGGVYYVASTGKELSRIEEPTFQRRKQAFVGAITVAGVEGALFGQANKAVTTRLSPEPFGSKVTGPVRGEVVQTQRSTITGTGVGVPVRPSTFTTYRYTENGGKRFLIGKEKLSTILTVNSRGGIVRKQYGKNFLSVTRQAPGAAARMTVYYRSPIGAKRTLKIAGPDLRKSFGAGRSFVLLGRTKPRRQETLSPEENVLFQETKGGALYGLQQRVGKDQYLVGIATQRARTAALSAAGPTTAFRSVSQVERIQLPTQQKILSSNIVDMDEVTFTVLRPRQSVQAVGLPESSAFGVADTVLRTAPRTKVAGQSLISSTRAIEDTPLPEAGTTIAYPVKTLVRKKGTVRTSIGYASVTEFTYGTVYGARSYTAEPVARESLTRIARSRERAIARTTAPEAPAGTVTSAPVTRTVAKARTVVVERLGTRITAPEVVAPEFTLPRQTRRPIGPLQRFSSGVITVPAAGMIEGQRKAPLERPALGSQSSIRPVTSLRRAPIINAATSRVSVARLGSVSISQTRLQQANIARPGTPRTPFRTTVPTRITPPGVPKFDWRPGGSVAGPQASIGLPTQQKGYNPSLAALVLNIRGPKLSRTKTRTGLFIRPVNT